MAVALAHFNNAFPANAGAAYMWHNAVDLFFCLSGFTLSYVYSRETFRFSDYLTARIARVYPLYVLCLISAGALYVWPYLVDPVTYPASRATLDFALQLAMLNAWPVIGTGMHWDAPAWSLSAEWFCYVVLFPLLLFRNAPSTVATRFLGIVVCSAVGFWLFARYYFEGSIGLSVPESQLSYWVPVVRATCGFVSGWLAFASFQRRDVLHAACTRFSGVIWCGVGLIVLLAYGGLINPQMPVFLWPFVVLAGTGEDSLSSRLLGSKPMHFLGVISYSIYMTHFIILISFMTRFGPLDIWSPAIFGLLAGTTVVVSIGTHFVLEVPARDAIRGLRRLRRAPAST